MNLMHGFGVLADPMNIVYMFVGITLGVLIGVLPGLGGANGVAILLPLTFGLDPTGAIVMLAAVYYGSMYGGTITSVLINTPGESATVASTFDGYPLAKQGRAGPALVMAALASFVAGTIGAVLLAFAAPTIADFACCGYLFYPEPFGFERADWPHVDAWLARIQALPGWKHPYDLMPGNPSDRAAKEDA